MPARRRLLWASLALSAVLFAVALGVAHAPVTPSNPLVMPAAPPTAAPLRASIRVAAPPAPGPIVVRAHRGQLVELAVTPPGPDAISIPAFDRTRPGSPSTPAHFSLVADRTGRFPLVLQSTGLTVGVLEIAPTATAP